MSYKKLNKSVSMKKQISKDYMQLIYENKRNNNKDKLSLKRYK